MYKTDSFISADEIKEIVGISKSKAYSLIQELNSELKEKGYLTDIRERMIYAFPCMVLSLSWILMGVIGIKDTAFVITVT